MNDKAFYLTGLVASALWVGSASASAPVGDAPVSSVSSPAPGDLTLRKSISDLTYARDSGHLALFKAINALREQLGVGLLIQDATLDAAAQAHAVYLSSNSLAQHDEAVENPDFYEVSPLSRARKAGAPAAQWVGEVVAVAKGGNDSGIGE